MFSRAQNHNEALALLEQAEADLERHLRRLLAWKDDAAYGMGDLSPRDASSALRHARALVARAEAMVAERFGSGP